MVWFYRKTLEAQIRPREGSNFQSHYGLILSDSRFRASNIHYFLSIPLWSDFIFSVRFLHTYLLIFFQSHYGLILSLSEVSKCCIVILAFNPTMVWFYLLPPGKLVAAPISSLSIPLWSDFILLPVSFVVLVERFPFNPTMVWFYPFPKKSPPVCFPAFNPTMVWFYLFEWLWRVEISLRFQSHYGLILSLRSWF